MRREEKEALVGRGINSYQLVVGSSNRVQENISSVNWSGNIFQTFSARLVLCLFTLVKSMSLQCETGLVRMSHRCTLYVETVVTLLSLTDVAEIVEEEN